MKIQNVLLICCLTALLLSCEDDKNGNGDDHQPGVEFRFTFVNQKLDNLFDTVNPVYYLDSLYILKAGTTDTLYPQDISQGVSSLEYKNRMILYYTPLSAGPDFSFIDESNFGPDPQQYFVRLNSRDIDTIEVLYDQGCARAQQPRFDHIPYCMTYNQAMVYSCNTCPRSRTDIYRNILIYK